MHFYLISYLNDENNETKTKSIRSVQPKIMNFQYKVFLDFT